MITSPRIVGLTRFRSSTRLGEDASSAGYTLAAIESRSSDSLSTSKRESGDGPDCPAGWKKRRQTAHAIWSYERPARSGGACQRRVWAPTPVLRQMWAQVRRYGPCTRTHAERPQHQGAGDHAPSLQAQKITLDRIFRDQTDRQQGRDVEKGEAPCDGNRTDSLR